MRPQFGGKANGSVRVDIAEASYVMKVTLKDLVPNANYLVNLHAGSCGPYAVPAGGRIITLHGPLDTPEAFVHIACADMTN